MLALALVRAFFLLVAVLCVVPHVKAQTNINFTCLVTFNGTNGSMPMSGLTLASDGNLYGTTYEGGRNELFNGGTGGTAFKMTPDGVITTIANFGKGSGHWPSGSLVQAKDGNIYGTTAQGGNLRDGTVFRLSLDGKLTTICSFGAYNETGGDSTNGWLPSGLILGVDGNLYGITGDFGFTGGATIFRATTEGKLSTLQVFRGRNTAHPNGYLLAAKNGDLYGTMDGQLFHISPNGFFGTNISYNSLNVSLAVAGLIRGKDGLLFGVVTRGTGGGAILKIDERGNFKVLAKISNTTGEFECPSGVIVEASDDFFYGYTYSGPFQRNCSIVRLKSDGSVVKLFSFAGCRPTDSLVEGKNGKIYGITAESHPLNQGTIFCFTPEKTQ